MSKNWRTLLANVGCGLGGWARAGQLQSIKLGGRRFVRRGEIRALVAAPRRVRAADLQPGLRYDHVVQALGGAGDPAAVTGYSLSFEERGRGGAGVSERESMAGGARAGLVDVKVVSFSDADTAEKFVIPVAKRPRTPALRP